ncbi:hypothetical protein N7494_002539 [Penicillium frequentans]|uniref:Major facilitator superfamily (MFS) profile domain-containing protein n=1 Tax=Penicillium frequentans TaxID=3151616 RepID=A0AAD6D4Z8_9EURO|nr:hypothetical protein N7494_002539 [Penicillium glabrum]
MRVQWADHDPEHPYNLSLRRKWLAVITVALGSPGWNSTCTSSIYSTTYNQIMSEFHCSQEIATLGLSLYIWGMGKLSTFVPIGKSLIFVSRRDWPAGAGSTIRGKLRLYGRRIVYLCSFATFFVWIFPCAFAKNIQTLLVGRFFSGFSGSAFLSVAGGTVGDLFPRHELAFPMMVYTASPFIGPEIGPLIPIGAGPSMYYSVGLQQCYFGYIVSYLKPINRCESTSMVSLWKEVDLFAPGSYVEKHNEYEIKPETQNLRHRTKNALLPSGL